MRNRNPLLVLLLGLSLSAHAQREPQGPQWIPLDGQSRPGTPIQATVAKTSAEGSTLELKVPGVWMESTTYAGRTFTRLLLPAVKLGGAGIPQKESERGWYDFPAETGQPPMSSSRFVNGILIGLNQPAFPETAINQKPRTADEMEKLGIDPAGARPGIPTLRGLFAVSQQNGRGDISVALQNSDAAATLQLPAPLVPAGFDGQDIIAPPRPGYTAPELIDEEFYANFKGSYRGTEEPASPVNPAGAGFAAIEARIPMIELTSPQVVRIPTNLVVEIKHLKGLEDFDCPIKWDAWTTVFPYLNGAALRESLTKKGIRIEASRSAHYLILTPRQYREELNEFALWKQAKGLNVDFAFVGPAATDDVAADRNAIDAYIEAYFKKNYCHGVYVLIVGDVDVIPSGRTDRIDSGPDYANADSDHIYEVLGGSRFPSVYVGRLSVNSEAELANQLRKILSYERDPAPGDWPRQAMLAANSQNDNSSLGVSPSFPSKYAKAVNDTVAYDGYSAPPTFQVLHAGAATAAADRAVNQDVIDGIQAGRGQVLYRGHGDTDGWVYGWDGSSSEGTSFTANPHIRMLSNRAYPIVYSIACQNGRIKANDAISELWMSWTNGGAVAHFGASVNSYTGENHERTKGIFKAFYESGFTRLGPGLAEAERISHVATGGGGAWDNNTYSYNLLGDPEMTVRKFPVLRFQLGGIFTNILNGVFIKISDAQGNLPPPGCFVQANLAGGATVNGFANEKGELVFPDLKSEQIASLDLHSDGYGAARIVPPRPAREWIALDPNAEPGAPVSVSLEKSDPTNTVFRLRVPGMWINRTQFGGREVATVEFPELDKLIGRGLPQKPGDRGWYDFPEDTGIPPMPASRYEHPFGVGVFQPVFPESALGKEPKTEREMIALGIDPAGARPGLPTLRGFLAVSRATGRGDLSVDVAGSTTKQIALPAPLRPAGFTGSDQTAERFGYRAPELFDEEFYAAFKGQYRGPEQPVEPSGSSGAFGVAQTSIPLMEALSPTDILVYTDLLVNIKHLKGAEDFECPFTWDSWIFHLPFINGAALRDSLTAKGIRIEGSRSARYLILTSRDYREELNEFAVWKQSKGLNVDFAYVGNGPADDVAPSRAAIDAYIEAYFKENYCHGVYVLIVGDVDVIPSGRSNRIDLGPDAANGDSDHIYEVLGTDRFASLYVGRLSVNNADELKAQLSKILSYERNPARGNWPTQATLAANSENDDGSQGVSASFPSKYAKAVNSIASFGSYTSPPAFEVLHAGASSSGATRAVNQDVIDALHEGRGTLLYRGHGSGSAWASGWDGTGTGGIGWSAGAHVSGLTNRAYPIVFSIACQNARLLNNDSIGEVWMNRANGGSSAHFGASVNSYTSENHERAKGIYRAIYDSGFTRLGPALAEAERLSYLATGGGGGWDNNTFCYNLLGDPEMTIRKKNIPQLGITTTLAGVPARAVLVFNDTSNQPIIGALVNVILDGRLLTTNLFTTAKGEIVLPGINPEQILAVQIHADGYQFSEADFRGASAELTSVGFDRERIYSFQIEATTGMWIIQGSPDLIRWEDIGTIEGGSVKLFSDEDSARLGHRFYRAIPSVRPQ